MPIIDLHNRHPLQDGRQSDQALFVRRGVQKLFSQMDIAGLSEVTLKNGRRADLMGVTAKGDIWIVEIKSSIADLKSDHKWQDYRSFCDQLYFATHDAVPMELFPSDCGFILANNFGGHIARDAPEHRLNAATRKAVMLRFGRCGAQRLTTLDLVGFGVNIKDAKD